MTKYAYVVRDQNQEITGIFTSVNAVKLSLETSLNENRGYSIDIDRIKFLSIYRAKRGIQWRFRCLRRLGILTSAHDNELQANG